LEPFSGFLDSFIAEMLGFLLFVEDTPAGFTPARVVDVEDPRVSLEVALCIPTVPALDFALEIAEFGFAIVFFPICGPGFAGDVDKRLVVGVWSLSLDEAVTPDKLADRCSVLGLVMDESTLEGRSAFRIGLESTAVDLTCFALVPFSFELFLLSLGVFGAVIVLFFPSS
jgi:hypothetical protein